MRGGRSRLAVLAAVAAVPLGAVLAATTALAGDESVAAVQPAVGALPDWRAPGGRLMLRGLATPDQEVAVRVGDAIAGRTTAGPRGRYRFEVRMPRRPGRYGVVVTSAGLEQLAGVVRVRPLTLAAVGDVNLDGAAPDAWTSVAPVLRKADLAVANLECSVSERRIAAVGKEFTFRGPPSALRGVAAAGIDAVTVANNHAVDFGRDAFLDTLAAARKAQISVAGGGKDLAAARRPVMLTAGGLRVALLGYSDVRHYGFDAGAGVPGTAPAFPELIAADVRAARGRADAVVVYFHWGEELMTLPTLRQRELAATAFGAGADVVLGAHPHVLQPVERSGPRKLVAWSLGNFVFAAHSPGTTSSGILLVGLASDGVRGARLRPARIEGTRPVLVP
jgi:poly-gamma-glutamate capsule biosynthesis protein CapA/YwtB (metallophosphatase superfamily)